MDGILENVVYNELIYRYGNACVCICTVGKYEIDFIMNLLDSPQYFQVCMSISDETTRERKLKPLRTMPDNYPKTVITYDRFLLDDVDGIKDRECIGLVEGILGVTMHPDSLIS